MTGIMKYIQETIDNKYRKNLIESGYSVPEKYTRCKYIVKEMREISKDKSILMTNKLHEKIIYHGSKELIKFIGYNGYRTKRTYIL